MCSSDLYSKAPGCATQSRLDFHLSKDKIVCGESPLPHPIPQQQPISNSAQGAAAIVSWLWMSSWPEAVTSTSSRNTRSSVSLPSPVRWSRI